MKTNANLAFNLVLIVIGMLALTYASVPLYRLFCEVTGYGGTTQQGVAQGRILDRDITIKFNADIDPGLAWEFKPGESQVKTKIGQQSLTHYVAKNSTNKSISGHATYNVIPFSAGQYFIKIDCFCFQEQTLEAGQKVDMPILFYIDPAIADDPQMNDVKTITLSYTFFPVNSDKK
jgi:cytochrome c oxidase assembly protein subunit 11